MYTALALSLLLSACGASKQAMADAESARTALNDCQTTLAQAETELNSTRQELADIRARAGNAGNRADDLRAENETLQSQLVAMQNQLSTVTQQMQAASDNFGVWYRVQIGAYEQRRIDKDLETTDQLTLEQQNALQKVALGRFRKYEDAKKLQDQLQAMGVKGAWVVSYKDGQRVPIETVRG
jgi:chromosome segregation ATPase